MMPIFRPDPFEIRTHYDNGSLPPPHHFEYTISIGPTNSGQVAYHPGYPGEGTPEWLYPFQVDGSALDDLFQLMLTQKMIQHKWHSAAGGDVGGARQWAEITCFRILTKIPPGLSAEDQEKIDPIFQAIKALVPQAVWAGLDERQKRYEAENS
jgi:hypothetical protein